MRALVSLGDSTGLPIYLEASPGSYGLYLKMGFRRVPEDVAKVVHEAEVLGTEKDVEVPLMIRLPAEVTNSGSEEGRKRVEEVYREWYGQREDEGYYSGEKETQRL